MPPTGLLQQVTTRFLVLAILICYCYIREGNTQPNCNQSFVWITLEENNGTATKSPKDIIDVSTFCPGYNYTFFNDTNENQFDWKTPQIIQCISCDAEARDVNSLYGNPWTIIVDVRDNEDNFTTLTVHVKLTSVNDFPASSNDLNGTKDVRESTSLGTVIFQCTLLDGDFPGSGHDIPYVEIISGNNDNKFAVDSRSCEIRLIDTLNRANTQSSYVLTFKTLNFENDPDFKTYTRTFKIDFDIDYPPKCNQVLFYIAVPEDVQLTYPLTTLNCTNNDGSTDVDYYRDNPSSIPELNVDQQTGVVFVDRKLHYDTVPANNKKLITIIAVRKGNTYINPRRTVITVNVLILDVDNNIPQMKSKIFSASISSNTPLGTPVLKVEATDADVPNTFNSKMTFVFNQTCVPDVLTLDTNEGSLYLKANVTGPSVIKCKVDVYSSNKKMDTTSADVSITVNSEVTNNPPTFLQHVYIGNVTENSQVPTYVLTVSATDPDSGTVTYFFPSGSTLPFEVRDVSGSITVSKAVIDYEQQSKPYYSPIFAVDSGLPPLTATANIAINVIAENEYMPEFPPLSPVDVNKFDEPGTLITTIAVSDKDHGPDGIVQCRLQDPSLPFILDSQTCKLWIGFGLEKTTVQFYDVAIIASDMSLTTPKSNNATLRINIKTDNKNYNYPQCSPLGPLLVTPNSPAVGDPVDYLNCKDDDTTTVILSYTLIGGDPYSLFLITANGTIRLNTTPIAGSYTVVFQVSDQQKPSPKTTTVSVQINVETNLRFLNLPNNTFILENTAISTAVFTVMATGSYDLIKYEITNGNFQRTFNLHPTTGELRLAKQVDRETLNIYTLEISISTSGQLLKANLIVNIDDVNDNAPKFKSSLSYLKLSEKQTVPRQISTYTATDDDAGINAQIFYSIVSGNSDGSFTINVNTGLLMLVKSLDYKVKPFYTLVLRAFDGGTPSLSSTMIVNVEVLEVFDNSLVIVVPSGGRTTLQIPECTTIGSAVIKITLQNNNTNDDVTFSITSGNTGDVFSINKRTGVLYLIYALDRESVDNMKIVVQVNNSNGKVNQTFLAINITDCNDNAPLFKPTYYVFYIPHATMAGTNIGALTVSDPDVGENATFTLSIDSGGYGRFSFIGKTLIATAYIDYNVITTYDMQAMALDNGNPPLNSTAYIKVYVDPDYKKPLFVPKYHNIFIEETKAVGSLLHDSDARVAGATEQTSTNPGDLTYKLNSGDSTKFFVEDDTGVVKLISATNYSKNTLFVLTVMAYNKFKPSLTDNLTLTIKVTQINRYDPVFSSDVYVWRVDETAKSGTIVGRVIATDKDPGQYGDVRYELESNNNFVINPNTGVITLVNILDYSIAKSYDLLVTATDNAGTSSRNGFCLVIIIVIDWNNNYPTFIKNSYEVTASESLPLGTVILVVNAVDLDSGTNGTVIYSITLGNSKGIFSMNALSGALSLRSSLDYESIQQHTLTVQANDGGQPSLSNTTLVIVHVKDENDNDPDFGTSWIDVTIRFDIPPLTSIYRCSAHDADSGNNGLVNYFILNGNNDNLFMIDQYSGVVTTAASVALSNSFQVLTIAAKDHGMYARTGKVTFAVTIQPAQKPGSSNYDFSVSENKAKGTIVGTIQNTASLGITNCIIRGGNSGDSFTIDNNSTIRTNVVLDRESTTYFQLSISILTSTTTSQVTVTIKVTDENDNPPVIVKSVQFIQMVENLAPSYIAAQFTITDIDEAGPNSQYDLSIKPATRPAITYFDISSGALKLIRSISYEQISSFVFYVVAKDRGVPQQSYSATVSVQIIDVNEQKVYNEFETAHFTSCDFPDDAKNGDTVCMLTAAHVGVTVAAGDAVIFTIAGKDSIFTVHSSTGYLHVSKQDLITPTTRYIQWVVVTTTQGGVKTSHALMVRLDTFNKKKHLISVKVGATIEDLQSQLSNLQNNLQQLYKSPKTVKIWKIQSPTTNVIRRKLLASESEAFVVVENDGAGNDISNIDVTKTFMTSEEAVKTLQQSSDGTPKPSLSSSSPPVTSVKPYSPTDDSLDPAYIALIVIGTLFLLALIIAIIVLIIYCRYYRRGRTQDKTVLVRTKNKSQQTFENIQKPKKNKTPSQQTGNVSNSKQLKTAPRPLVYKTYPDNPDADGMPVRPTTATFISSTLTSAEAQTTKPKIQPSTMLENLEERNEENIENNTSAI